MAGRIRTFGRPPDGPMAGRCAKSRVPDGGEQSNGAAAAQVSDPTYALSLSFGTETVAGTITTDGNATLGKTRISWPTT